MCTHIQLAKLFVMIESIRSPSADETFIMCVLLKYTGPPNFFLWGGGVGGGEGDLVQQTTTQAHLSHLGPLL